MEPVHVPITDELDLHTFRPSEVSDLLDDYFDACLDLGIQRARIIHGKGSGQLKRRVETLLARHPLVERWQPAPAEAGGWGATLVEFGARGQTGDGS